MNSVRTLQSFIAAEIRQGHAPFFRCTVMLHGYRIEQSGTKAEISYGYAWPKRKRNGACDNEGPSDDLSSAVKWSS